MNKARFSVLLLAGLFLQRGAFAQTASTPEASAPVAADPVTPAESATAVPSSVASDTAATPPTEAEQVAATTPPAAEKKNASTAALGIGEVGANRRFVMWRDDETGAYIKPILWVSSAVIGYFPSNTGNPDLADEVDTLVVSRFGFEGAVNSNVSFKLQFERNLGFSSAAGPTGTGVWEGTASLQARENYINLHRWGLSVIAGIATDPASIDYVTPYVFNLFGMDPYTRDFLLFSGFSMSQGVLLRYEDPLLRYLGAPGKLTYGFHFTAGNPLTTSLSYGFGGAVSSLGTLYTAPLRAMANGFPGSDIQLMTFSPSLSYEVDITKDVGIDFRAAAQFYKVDVDTTGATDAHISGLNLRSTARLRLPYVNIMGGFARRTNDQLPIPDITRVQGDGYESTVWSIGGDVTYAGFGLGTHYASVLQELTENSKNTQKYFNVAASYAVIQDYIGVTLRYASLTNDPVNAGVVPTDSKSLMLSLQLTI